MRNTKPFSESLGVYQRRASFTQRYNRRSIRDREEIEPAPDRLIAALPHRIEVHSCEIADLDVDFENASAIRTLKNRSGSWLMPTLRTPKFAYHAHRICPVTRWAVKKCHSFKSSRFNVQRWGTVQVVQIVQSLKTAIFQSSITPSLPYSNLAASTPSAVRFRSTTSPTPPPSRPHRIPQLWRRPKSRYRS